MGFKKCILDMCLRETRKGIWQLYLSDFLLQSNLFLASDHSFLSFIFQRFDVEFAFLSSQSHSLRCLPKYYVSYNLDIFDSKLTPVLEIFEV